MPKHGIAIIESRQHADRQALRAHSAGPGQLPDFSIERIGIRPIALIQETAEQRIYVSLYTHVYIMHIPAEMGL